MKKTIYLFIAGILFMSCSFQKSISPVKKIEDINYPFDVKKIKLKNNIEIAYTEQGGGETTILFLHGLGSNMMAWKNNIPELKKHFRCIAFDWPGYGKSSKGKYEGSMQFYSKITAEFIDKMNLGKVVLAGHSMGGQIAVTTALAFPGKIDKLILASPAGFETFTKGQKQWLRDVFTSDLVKYTPVENIKNNLANNFYNMPKDAEFMIKDRIEMRTADDFDWYAYIIPKNVQGMVDAPVFEYLKEIKQPVLVLFGKNDNLIPNRFLNGGNTEKYARAGAEQIPDCKLVMVDKAGHFAQFEQAGVFNENVISFLKK